MEGETELIGCCSCSYLAGPRRTAYLPFRQAMIHSVVNNRAVRSSRFGRTNLTRENVAPRRHHDRREEEFPRLHRKAVCLQDLGGVECHGVELKTPIF